MGVKKMYDLLLTNNQIKNHLYKNAQKQQCITC